MLIHLITVGQRLDRWVVEGYTEFSKRLPLECRLKLVEIPVSKRSRNNDIAQLINQEGERMLSAIPNNALVVALDEAGKPWSTLTLAKNLDDWLHSGRDIALLVGGPDGLSTACKAKAELTWSLSNLTLPHALVRIVVAEQVYRAWSILKRHPYHRG